MTGTDKKIFMANNEKEYIWETQDNIKIKTSRVGVTYKTGFGLDGIYCTLYIHSSELQAIADFHTLYSSLSQALGFSVFASSVLSKDL
jgi:hypothetical protein